MYFSKLSSAEVIWTRTSLISVASLLDCISPSWRSPRLLPNLFVHHFLVCRVCLTWPWVESRIHGDEFSSLHVHLKTYRTVGRANILIAWNTFPAFSFDMRAYLTNLKYLVLTLPFIRSWQISVLSMMSKYLQPSSSILPITSSFPIVIPSHSDSLPLRIARL